MNRIVILHMQIVELLVICRSGYVSICGVCTHRCNFDIKESNCFYTSYVCVTEKDKIKRNWLDVRFAEEWLTVFLFMRRIVAFYLLIGIKNEEDGRRKTMGERRKLAACKLLGCELKVCCSSQNLGAHSSKI